MALLSEEQITKYQQLIKKRFNRDISREKAYEEGVKLLRLVELVYKPITEADLELVEKRRKETGYAG